MCDCMVIRTDSAEVIHPLRVAEGKRVAIAYVECHTCKPGNRSD
jgi:hypothetical protein